jgi:cytochrome P450
MDRSFINDVATYDEDFFTEEHLADSVPVFRRWRDMGDLVWSPPLDSFIVARYDDAVLCLRSPDVAISGHGVTVNPMLSGPDQPQASTILTDGEEHRRLRGVEIQPLLPGSVRQLTERVDQLADDRVQELTDGSLFEGMDRLASHLPVATVADLVGINGVDSARMLAWSKAAFDAFGPENNRTMEALPTLLDLGGFVAQLDAADLKPGGWADQLMDAAKAGTITPEEAAGLLQDYIVPSLDTTILATGELLFQLAGNPELLPMLRERPELIDGAIHEAVRLGTPIRGFSRLLTADLELTEHVLPAGARVWIVYASANRDERHYSDPDRFDPERGATDHLGWGMGVHLCVGKHLSMLEMGALVRALIRHVERIEIDTPTRLVNNGLQGFQELPMRLVPR